MGRKRSDAEQQIADLLQTAKKSLHLSVAFLSRLDGTTQHLEVVESSVPFLFQEGYQQKQDVTLCQAILDKKIPQVIPDLTVFPVALGQGKRLFGEGTIPRSWRLISSKTTPSGAVMAAYERAGDVETGYVGPE